MAEYFNASNDRALARLGGSMRTVNRNRKTPGQVARYLRRHGHTHAPGASTLDWNWAVDKSDHPTGKPRGRQPRGKQQRKAGNCYP